MNKTRVCLRMNKQQLCWYPFCHEADANVLRQWTAIPFSVIASNANHQTTWSMLLSSENSKFDDVQQKEMDATEKANAYHFSVWHCRWQQWQIFGCIDYRQISYDNRLPPFSCSSVCRFAFDATVFNTNKSADTALLAASDVMLVHRGQHIHRKKEIFFLLYQRQHCIWGSHASEQPKFSTIHTALTLWWNQCR